MENIMVFSVSALNEAIQQLSRDGGILIANNPNIDSFAIGNIAGLFLVASIIAAFVGIKLKIAPRRMSLIACSIFSVFAYMTWQMNFVSIPTKIEKSALLVLNADACVSGGEVRNANLVGLLDARRVVVNELKNGKNIVCASRKI